MREQNALRLKNGLIGAGLALFFCAVCYAVSAIVFSEMEKVSAALITVTVISAISAGAYLVLELFVFFKTNSSAFAIGYFGTLAIVSAVVFLVTALIPMENFFDFPASVNATYVRLSCMRLCIFNSIALVARLGEETVRYIRAVMGSGD